MQTKNKLGDFVRKDRMAHLGANYECKKCGAKIDVAAEVPYGERDEASLREHPECGA